MTRQPADRVLHWFALDKALDRMHKKKAPAKELPKAGALRVHHDIYPNPIVLPIKTENNHHDNRN